MNTNSRLSFHQVRIQHNIPLERIIEETKHDARAVHLVDQYGIGNPFVIDDMLAVLSRLTNSTYTRHNIGGFEFSLHPDYNLID